MTVKSVRETAGDKVDIITINDCSTDGFPYRERLQSYSVVYLENEVRMGVAASRDYGINYCTTPYFLLLDGHMRFYDAAWSSLLLPKDGILPYHARVWAQMDGLYLLNNKSL